MAYNHPHARGEDERFTYGFGLYNINVDAIRRDIASGKIKPKRRDYPVEQIGSQVLQMKKSEFGSNNFDTPDSFSLIATYTNRKVMKSIPDDKMTEPVIFIMWDHDAASERAFGKAEKSDIGRTPVMIDGNHRAGRRYLEGDPGMIDCYFVDWEDAIPHILFRGQKY